MSKYDLAGAHVINKYVYANLKNILPYMDKSNYDGLVPIIPTQQIAVFNNMGPAKPFIVYTYASTGFTTDIWDRTESMAYTIYSDDETRLREVTHRLTDLLHRYDDTAREVNDFIDFALTNPSGDTDDKKFQFNYITVVGTMGPEPYTTEGGRQAASVSLRYSYLVDENQRGMRA